MEIKEILIQAIRNTEGLPAVLRDHAHKVGVCESETFDDDHFEYLDSQILKYASSDPAQAEQFKKRRAAFLPFRNVTLLQGSLWTDETAFNFWVDPEKQTVIYSHEWAPERFKIARKMIETSKKLKALEQKQES
jgi:hypothetical protein